MKEKIVQALSDILYHNEKVTISHLKTGIKSNSYIVYGLYATTTEYADNDENGEIQYYTVDIYTKYADFNKLVTEVRKRLRGIGCSVTKGIETYEADTGLYHIVSDICIAKEE